MVRDKWHWKFRRFLRNIKNGTVKRDIRLIWQRIVRGWDDSDTWSLDHTMSKFILPRLIRYKELNIVLPCQFKTKEEWDAALDDMIYFHEVHANGLWEYGKFDADWDKYERGKKLFGEMYGQLWW